MAVSQHFVNRLKAAVDLKELARKYGAELHPAGSDIWQSRCPHPEHNKKDHSPSFTIYKKNGEWAWCCYGCHVGPKDIKNGNYGSDCIAFLQWMSNGKKSFPAIIKELSELTGIPMEEDKYAPQYRENKILAKAYHANLPSYVRSYLYERGLEDADIEEWMLGYNVMPEYRPVHKFVGRLTIPLFDNYKQVLGFSSRILPGEAEGVPKYKNSSNSEWFSKRSYLFGIDKIDSSFPEIRITEGAMDVILAHKHGVKNVVCSLGTSFTEEHALYIKNKGLIPCFCFDADDAGRKAAKKAVSMMAQIGVFAKVFFVPEGKDLADFSNIEKENAEEYIQQHSMAYWEYELQEAVKLFDAQIQEARRKAMPAIEAACAGVNCKSEEFLMKNFVRERFGVTL